MFLRNVECSEFYKILTIYIWTFEHLRLEICRNFKGVHCVDLGESFQMRRTSPLKFGLPAPAPHWSNKQPSKRLLSSSDTPVDCQNVPVIMCWKKVFFVNFFSGISGVALPLALLLLSKLARSTVPIASLARSVNDGLLLPGASFPKKTLTNI